MSVRKIVSNAEHPRRKVRWEAMWYVDGKQVTARFDTREEAAEHEARMRTNLADGCYVAPDKARTLVGEYVEIFLEHCRAKDSTLDLYRSHLRNHVLPAFGDRRLGDVKRVDLKRFVTDLSHKLAPSTVETVFKITAMVFRSAVEDELLASSPCTRGQPARGPRAGDAGVRPR